MSHLNNIQNQQYQRDNYYMYQQCASRSFYNLQGLVRTSHYKSLQKCDLLQPHHGCSIPRSVRPDKKWLGTAVKAAMLDNDQYVVYSIMAYRGDPDQRTSMESEVRLHRVKALLGGTSMKGYGARE